MNMCQPAALPIDDVLPAVCATLADRNRLVLAAPPGAGKTTRVPLALAGLDGRPRPVAGRVLVLEPRRIAARMAAERMAASIGEPVGGRIGLSTRIERRVSEATLVEVVTDGLFTRRILSDPTLDEVGAVLFDEFHERRLNSDLGLALAADAQVALREDLRLLVMSATLDIARVATALGAPVVESQGRQYPVETRYVGSGEDPVEARMAGVIRRVLREEQGSILAFLPGAREINRVADMLGDLPAGVSVAPLYGALPPAAQDEAVRGPRPGERKIVLATDIAESSLTIEGVRIVIDSGLARLAEDSPGGLGQRLTTVRASRASVDQRRGRAGRLGPGICYRLWDEAATRGLTPSPVPEIMTSDLSGLALALADWGTDQPSQLTWLDPPPAGKLAAARGQLAAFGALDAAGRITSRGRAMAKLPLPPRLAALVLSARDAGERALAANVAALLSERGMGGDSTDLTERLRHFRTDNSPRATALKSQARAWGASAAPAGELAMLLTRAWPGEVARRRPDASDVYLMASGGAARVPPGDVLAKSEWLLVCELGGAAREPRIILALPISQDDALNSQPVTDEAVASYDPATRRFSARRIRRLGAIVLSETPLPKPGAAAARDAVLAALASGGFAVIGACEVIEETLARAAILAKVGLIDPLPLSDQQLIETSPCWLGPLLLRKGAEVPSPAEIRDALIQSLAWPVQQALATHAPLTLELPSGQTAQVDWRDPRAPLVSARVQAFFGLREHPRLAAGRVPVTLEMLSPAMKPVATTQDLARFWGAGYRDMAKDMRGRYPKHDWPDDPATARAHEGRTRKRL